MPLYCDRSYIGAGRYRKRKRRGIRGRGGYIDDIKNAWGTYRKYIPRIVGAAGGAILGGKLDAGWDMGAKVSNALGWGSYRFKGRGAYTPSGKPGTVGNQLMGYDKPITVNTSSDETGDIYISHREFIGNVDASVQLSGGATTGASQYTSVTYPLNAGLTTSFPWLSQVRMWVNY